MKLLSENRVELWLRCSRIKGSDFSLGFYLSLVQSMLEHLSQDFSLWTLVPSRYNWVLGYREINRFRKVKLQTFVLLQVSFEASSTAMSNLYCNRLKRSKPKCRRLYIPALGRRLYLHRNKGDGPMILGSPISIHLARAEK